MRNYLTFNGKDIRDFGVYISGQGTFSAPARGYDFIQVPGRNGDLIGNERRLENLELTYPAFVYVDYKTSMRGLRSFLLSQIGYKRLIDTYHPDEYRLACFVGPLETETMNNNRAGNFDLVFMCKPQRYLLSGDEVQTFTAADTIRNPTLFDARPLIRVYGNGTLGIGDEYITIANSPYDYIDIDCDLMDAFRGATNCNQYVTVSGNDFPVIPPDETGISLSGITRADITPRWWQV